MIYQNSVQSDSPVQRLFERGEIGLTGEHCSYNEVSRGMLILTHEGQDAGRVAAVVVDGNSQQVTHILLKHNYLVPAYRLVPIDLIEYISQQVILLHINRETVADLPTRIT